MQPYFFPYAGYFRLLASVDEFVILDSAQFPRRGRVHRTEVPGPSGEPEWLTLPLAKQPREILIADLEFAAEARGTLDERLERLPWIQTAQGPCAEALRDYLRGELGDVVDFLEKGLRLSADLIGLEVTISRSSDLDIDPDLRGQDRIVAIAQARGAAVYLNSPGGRMLYEASAFAAAGMSLSFLPHYSGPYVHLLHALMTEDPATIRADIEATG
jgi:hypothetical protein